MCFPQKYNHFNVRNYSVIFLKVPVHNTVSGTWVAFAKYTIFITVVLIIKAIIQLSSIE